MNTETRHTHRFDLDTAICTRCGATHAEVQEQRAAAVNTPAEQRRDDLAATARINDKNDRAANRRSYYERTGR